MDEQVCRLRGMEQVELRWQPNGCSTRPPSWVSDRMIQVLVRSRKDRKSSSLARDAPSTPKNACISAQA